MRDSARLILIAIKSIELKKIFSVRNLKLDFNTRAVSRDRVYEPMKMEDYTGSMRDCARLTIVAVEPTALKAGTLSHPLLHSPACLFKKSSPASSDAVQPPLRTLHEILDQHVLPPVRLPKSAAQLQSMR